MNVDRPRARAGRLLRDRRRRRSPPPPAPRCRAKRQGRVAVAFFGDGATNQAYFHECLNFAAVARAAGRVRLREQPLRRVHADAAGHRRARHRRPRARPTGCRAAVVDGNDLWAVDEAAREAVDRARGGGGADAARVPAPTATTATRSPTRRPTGPKEEVERWLERDPLKLARERLLERRRRRGRDRAAERDVRARRSTAPSRPRSPRRIPTRAEDGATEFARMSTLEFRDRDPRRDRRGDGARPARRLLRRGRRPPPAASSRSRPGLHERFGDERVFDTPISELALAGAAFGAAVTGLRPVIEIMFGDFMALPMDSLVNQAAKFWYISNEQASGAARRALGGRRRRPLRRHPLADPRHLVPGHPGAEDRAAVDRRPRPRGCSRARSATTTRCSSSSTSGCTRSRAPAPSRSRRSRSARRAWRARATTSRSSRSARACATRSPPPRSSPATGSTPRSSTCARCARSTSTTVLESVAKTNRLLAVEEGPRTGGWATGAARRGRRGRRCTTSTTPGSSPPTRPRSPTARRSRTRSCPNARDDRRERR